MKIQMGLLPAVVTAVLVAARLARMEALRVHPMEALAVAKAKARQHANSAKQVKSSMLAVVVAVPCRAAMELVALVVAQQADNLPQQIQVVAVAVAITIAAPLAPAALAS